MDVSDLPNRCPSAATACLYGISEAAVLGAGYAPAVGFIHTGKPLSFVYDVAGIYKLGRQRTAALVTTSPRLHEVLAAPAPRKPARDPQNTIDIVSNSRHRYGRVQAVSEVIWMRVFISWSGERSRAVAVALRAWLPDVIERIDVWTASKDIEPGQRWNSVLAAKLEETGCGILCVTPQNIRSPWLLFEAGALSKSLTEARVIPYLVDLSAAELEDPLRQFQSVQADDVGSHQLARTILTARDGDDRGVERLGRVFKSMWPELKSSLSRLPSESREPSTHELVKRCFALLRDQNNYHEQWRSGQRLQAAHAQLLFETIVARRNDGVGMVELASSALIEWIERRVELEEKLRPLRERAEHLEQEGEMESAMGYGVRGETAEHQARTVRQMGPIELEIQKVDRKLMKALQDGLTEKPRAVEA